MKLSAVESSISEREAVWREGGGPAVQHNQGAQLRTLQGEREGLLKEVRELQDRVKLDSFLSLEEERRWVGHSHSGSTSMGPMPHALCPSMYFVYPKCVLMYVCMCSVSALTVLMALCSRDHQLCTISVSSWNVIGHRSLNPLIYLLYVEFGVTLDGVLCM